MQNGSRMITFDQHPFSPIYRELPDAVCGYVFMLVSMQCKKRFHIGESTDLKRSLRLINTGHGPEVTRNTALHPWGVYGFAFGFELESLDGGAEARREFANSWSCMRAYSRSADELFHGSTIIADDLTWRRYKITIVKCGQMNQ